MADTRNNQSQRDPSNTMPDMINIWKQWTDANLDLWSKATAGPVNAGDPFAAYRQWLQSFDGARANGGLNPMGVLSPVELYKQWLGMMRGVFENVAQSGADPMGTAGQSVGMLDDMQARVSAGDVFPSDPLTLMRQWYDASSEAWAKAAGDLVGNEAVLEVGSQLVDSYASFQKTFSRASEQYYHGLQLPTRSDIARVAGLVVALEEKVDRIDEAFEDFEYGYAKPATAENAAVLEERLTHTDGKLDELIQAQSRNAESAASQARADLDERLNHVDEKLDQLLQARSQDDESSSPQSAAKLEDRLKVVETKLDQLLQALAPTDDAPAKPKPPRRRSRRTTPMAEATDGDE